MSVVLQFEVTNCTCDEIIFKETTKTYDVSTNPTGWGVPNSTIAQAETATLTVVTPDGTSTVLNLFSNFPTTDDTLEYSILPSDLGLTSFSDGEYSFTYNVTRTTATAFDYTQVSNNLFYCNAECCVDGLFADAGDFTCECNSAKLALALKGDTLLKCLERAAKCGNATTFNNLLLVLQGICGTESDCGCN
jgi:hypothetical protein